VKPFMHPNHPKPIPPPIALRIRDLFRRLRVLLTRFETCFEELDAVVCEFSDLIPLLGASAETLPLRLQLLRADVARGERRRLQKEQARHGAISVKLVPKANRYGLVEIDARPGVLLPPFVAALLAVLIADSGVKSDLFVGWKSIEAIRSELKASTGHSLSNAAIKELVLRLRDLLEEHGENRYLVQSKRNLGYRFALRRTKGGMTANDHR
jgi:hypothetical protein